MTESEKRTAVVLDEVKRFLLTNAIQAALFFRTLPNHRKQTVSKAQLDGVNVHSKAGGPSHDSVVKVVVRVAPALAVRDVVSVHTRCIVHVVFTAFA